MVGAGDKNNGIVMSGSAKLDDGATSRLIRL